VRSGIQINIRPPAPCPLRARTHVISNVTYSSGMRGHRASDVDWFVDRVAV